MKKRISKINDNRKSCLVNFYTCGILNSLRRLATCMDVKEEEAPTTPDTTTLFPNSRSVADSSLQVQAPSSMLLMDPARETEQNWSERVACASGAN